jgi:hypothetical protein
MTRTRTRTRRPTDPRDQAEALGYDTGSRAIPVVVEDVAVGVRSTMKVAKRASPVPRMDGVTRGMHLAAERFVKAVEHMDAGLGMGPMQAGAERVQEPRRGDALGVSLLPQERALSAAQAHAVGAAAIGQAAYPVVWDVVVVGMTLAAYDAKRRWREGTARGLLFPALERLAEAYECA